jgi:hypothetical protein
MNTDDLVAKLKKIINEETLDIDRLHELCQSIEESSDGLRAARGLFEVLEKFPDEDFSNPGPVVHTLESFFRHGYEALLVESLRRKPTFQTVWMLNRLINGTDGAERKEYVRLMSDISQSPTDDDARAEALRLMKKLK